jgi:hypothetical protein
MSNEITKAQSSILDVGVVWTKWLNTGDYIVSSVWEADSVTLVVSQEQHDATTTSCYMSGGTSGKQHKLTNRITTNDGLVDERYILVYIGEISV